MWNPLCLKLGLGALFAGPLRINRVVHYLDEAEVTPSHSEGRDVHHCILSSPVRGILLLRLLKQEVLTVDRGVTIVRAKLREAPLVLAKDALRTLLQLGKTELVMNHIFVLLFI